MNKVRNEGCTVNSRGCGDTSINNDVDKTGNTLFNYSNNINSSSNVTCTKSCSANCCGYFSSSSSNFKKIDSSTNNSDNDNDDADNEDCSSSSRSSSVKNNSTVSSNFSTCRYMSSGNTIPFSHLNKG